jgi:hypothetical protein
MTHPQAAHFLELGPSRTQPDGQPQRRTNAANAFSWAAMTSRVA